MKRLFIFLVVVSALPSLRSVVMGGFPFWFDPARDLLLALDNLKKLTLIGPPTGIPGLFYGPYWIWLLSLPLFFIRDPRWVILSVITVPYFVIFPIVLWQFKRIFGAGTVIALWLLFISAFNPYTSSLWNPHIAPILLLLLVFLIDVFYSSFLIGLAAGLILAFHFSLGVAAIVASLLTIFIFGLKRTGFTNLVIRLSYFAFGVALSLVPFFVFEARHGFNQVRAFYFALTNSLLYNSAVVGQVGLSKGEIIGSFQKTFANLLGISPWLLVAFEIIFVLWLGNKIRHRKITLDEVQKKLLIFLGLTLFLVGYLFFSSKNPVWDYHFIGIEVLFVFLLGIIMTKNHFLSKIVFFWSLIIFGGYLVSFLKDPIPNFLTVPSFLSKKTIVERIYADAGGKKFAVFPYAPALYTYDYDYLFPWIASSNGLSSPISNLQEARFVYLIIPDSPARTLADFVSYKTPDKSFRTISQWQTPDGTVIVKRQPVEPRL